MHAGAPNFHEPFLATEQFSSIIRGFEWISAAIAFLANIPECSEVAKFGLR